MFGSILERVGMTDTEVDVYETLLKLGESTTGPIVDNADVSRSKVYDVLARLQEKGLVSEVEKTGVNHYNAAHPKMLLEHLEQRQQELEEDKEAVEEILPDLEELYGQGIASKRAELYIGFSGMQAAFHTLLEETEDATYYAFGAGTGEREERVHRFFTELHQKREAQDIKSKIIFNEDSRGVFPEQEETDSVEARYIEHSTPAAVNIYGGTLIIAILTQEPVAVLIRGSETADSFKQYFRVLWKAAA